VEFVATTPPPRGRVAVPGCGRGHDVRYLVRQGYDAIGFDFSDTAVAEARARASTEGVAAPIELRDIFTLSREYANAFDGIWEYTCFCAIDPARRAEYVRVMDAVLRPGGWLLACFYPMRASGAGPPFPVRQDEVRRLLTPWFRIEHASTQIRSVHRRLGQEWMVLARKVGAPA
jgi:SAM-dependent methyltransferase